MESCSSNRITVLAGPHSEALRQSPSSPARRWLSPLPSAVRAPRLSGYWRTYLTDRTQPPLSVRTATICVGQSIIHRLLLATNLSPRLVAHKARSNPSVPGSNHPLFRPTRPRPANRCPLLLPPPFSVSVAVGDVTS
uniref:Uncharacterized protein n=1 Tax=Plectus sambesii TaxID=2011161 RepID=A0A914WS25_9BILA